MSASFSATAGRRSASGASARARRSARASGSAVSTSRVRWSSVSPERPSACARSARSYDARTCSHGRAGPAMHPRAVSEASSPARRRPWASGTSSSVESSGMSAPVDGLEHHPGQRTAHGPRLRLRHDHRRQRASAASTRPGRPPPGRARSATRRAGRRPAVRGAARGRGRSWPARRCGRRRSRPTARRCRRTPAPRSPRAGRPGCRRPRRAPTSPARPPGPRCGRRTAARRWSVRCAPRRGRAGRRPPWPAPSACPGSAPRRPPASERKPPSASCTALPMISPMPPLSAPS